MLFKCFPPVHTFNDVHDFQGVVELDLSSLESVRKCAAEILECYEKVDLLICNAGVSVPPSQGLKTRDGIEINFGVNHLGHFLLTNLLVDRMKQSAPARYPLPMSCLDNNCSFIFLISKILLEII